MIIEKEKTHVNKEAMKSRKKEKVPKDKMSNKDKKDKMVTQ